jgi:hypothetical protein
VSLIAVTGVFAVLLPSARVSLAPETTLRSVELAVALASQLEDTDRDAAIPALELARTLSGELRLPTSGRTEVATSYAEGEIQVVNLTPDEQTIPAGTSVRPAGREDLYFLTSQTLVLEGEEIAFVGIRAAQPGPVGNLPRTQVDSVDGPAGLVISVTNPEPIQGGAESSRASPTPADRSRLYHQLGAQLLEQARAEWVETLPEGTVLHPESVSVAEVLSEEYTVELGVPADSHALRLELRVSALAFRQDDLLQAARAALDSQRPPDYAHVPESLDVEPAADLTAAGQADQIRITASELTYRWTDPRTVARSLAGLTLAEALKTVQSMVDLSRPPVFELAPAWWRRMPFLPIQIEVDWIWDR